MLAGRSKVIALSGASGSVGRHLVEELLLHKEFNVLLLLRKENKKFIEELKSAKNNSGNLEYEIVDFQDQESIKYALSKHNVDTIISTLSSFDGSHVEVENNLIDAAISVGHIKRYVPSAWQVDPSKIPHWDNFEHLRKLQQKLDDLNHEGKITFTMFANGAFMNYLAYGASPRIDLNNPGSNERRLGTGHLKPFPFIIDPVELTASIPGTGNEPFVMTTIQDTSRYVAAACKLESTWGRETGLIVGDITTFNKIKDIYEATFDKKFKVSYESRQELENRLQVLNSEAEPGNPEIIFVQSKLLIASNSCTWKNSLSENINFVPTTVDNFIKQWWA